jgi:hypothetical protein
MLIQLKEAGLPVHDLTKYKLNSEEVITHI